MFISGSEKRHLTVILTVAADGFIFPAIIIFRGKTNLTIKEIVAHDKCFVIVTQEKVWMYESLIFTSLWQNYAKEKQGIRLQTIFCGK